MGRCLQRPSAAVIKHNRDNHEHLEEVTMIDNRASLCNGTDTIATFITDSVDLMLELEIRKIAPEKVVGVLPMMAHTEDSSIAQPRLRVLYRTSHAGIPIQTAHNDQFY
jgi:hypothetical protein